MSRKGKLPPIKSQSLLMRTVERTSNGLAVIATETPVERYDERIGWHKEVLLMSGCVLRGGRDQIPIVDSHNDKTVRNVFGSIRDMRIDQATGKLFGSPAFASDVDAQVIASRFQEGHLTDFSITADILDGFVVARGQSHTLRSGEVIDGPAKIITKWMPINASICATGADVNSVVMRSYDTTNRRTERSMDEAILSSLVAMGMPEGMTDPNQILAWVAGNMTAKQSQSTEQEMPESVSGVAESMAETETPEAAAPPDSTTEDTTMEDSKQAVERALKEDVLRRKEIVAICTKVGLDREYADQLCDSGTPLDQARSQIIERIASKSKPLGQTTEDQQVNARVVAGEDEKFIGAVRDGLITRAFTAINKKPKFENGPAPGHESFTGMSMKRIAERFLQRSNINTDRISERDIAMIALGNKATIDRCRVERAYHTTGSFANLLLDAANKSLLAAYEESQFTGFMWARQAASVPDFKNINRMRFSEVGNLEMVPERHEYKEKTMSDSKESYRVDKFGGLFTVSWETVVNDDLDAISRVPAMQGQAARRTVNAKIYEVLTSNPTMGDGYSLFSSSHASGDNTSGAAAAPSVTTLNAAFTKMMKQKGLNSDAVLNIQPKFLIVPVAYAATAMELVSSTSYAVANGNQGIVNIYGPNGSRAGLVVVAEPVLDASSATTWYLAADSSQIDTVEYCFLQGEESPVLESEWDFQKDCYAYKVRQTFGVKAIDWRGLYTNQ